MQQQSACQMDNDNHGENSVVSNMEDIFDGVVKHEEDKVYGQEQIEDALLQQLNPEFDVSSQSNGSHGMTSKGAKRKTPMNDLIESEMERINMGTRELTDFMRDGNCHHQRFIKIAEKQVEIAEKQVEIAEKRLAILEHSMPRYYSENDVWSELEKLGIVSELHMRCYRFLCRDERAKREFFGVPFEVRLSILYELMREAGVL